MKASSFLDVATKYGICLQYLSHLFDLFEPFGSNNYPFGNDKNLSGKRRPVDLLLSENDLLDEMALL